MRLVVKRLAFAGLLIFVFPACKGDSKSTNSAVVENSGEVSAEEEALMSRRDALLKSRQKLREERATLEKERVEIVSQGGDTSELDDRAAALQKKEDEIGEEESAVFEKLDTIIEQRREMVQALTANENDDKARMTAREAGMATREKSLAAREGKVAEREAAMADRERALALREKEMCSAAPPQTIIQTVPSPSGTKYSRSDVDALLKKARRAMGKKGILSSDLPAQARNLQREATKAMASGDYGEARFAAAQLVATVNAMKIDKAFIAAKIGRLSAAMKGKKLSGSKQSSVDGLFRQATSDYGDGKFTSANKRLNKIYATID